MLYCFCRVQSQWQWVVCRCQDPESLSFTSRLSRLKHTTPNNEGLDKKMIIAITDLFNGKPVTACSYYQPTYVTFYFLRCSIVLKLHDRDLDPFILHMAQANLIYLFAKCIASFMTMFYCQQERWIMKQEKRQGWRADWILFLADIKFLTIHKLTSWLDCNQRGTKTDDHQPTNTHFISIIQHLQPS